MEQEEIVRRVEHVMTWCRENDYGTSPLMTHRFSLFSTSGRGLASLVGKADFNKALGAWCEVVQHQILRLGDDDLVNAALVQELEELHPVITHYLAIRAAATACGDVRA